ncbi:MAG: HAD family hydrolase [Clostridia bacterium]|nr:HAD family hydrolase [Clostridia bacterium]
MIKACIFDLDGTLMDTLGAIAACGNDALRQVGLLPYPQERYGYFAGNGAKKLVERMLEGQNAYTPAMFDKVFPLFSAIYDQKGACSVTPFPDIPLLLEKLKERGIALAVLSNKPHGIVLDIINRFFGDSFFAAVEGQQEGKRNKPDPEGVFCVLESLCVTPEECLLVGDSDVDVETAKAAGVFSVGVSWGFRPKRELEEAGASAIIDTPLDLLRYI